MCKRYGKSVDHLLLYCDMAYAIWIAFFSRGGLSWVMPRRVVDLYACWWTFGRPQSSVAWNMVHTCFIWCLWREMNYKSFEDWERTKERLNLYSSKLCICGQLLMCLF
jgi:hypothetical protein